MASIEHHTLQQMKWGHHLCVITHNTNTQAWAAWESKSDLSMQPMSECNHVELSSISIQVIK